MTQTSASRLSSGPSTPISRSSGRRPISAPQSGMTIWPEEVQDLVPDLVQLVDDAHGGILAASPATGGRAGRVGRPRPDERPRDGQRGRPRRGLPVFFVAPRPGRQPRRSASPSVPSSPGAPPPRSGATGRRRAPIDAPPTAGRSSRRTSQLAPAVRPPRRRTARPSSMSSVTTRISAPAARAASVVPPLPTASATRRSMSASAVVRPLWRTVSPAAIRVPREARLRRAVEDELDPDGAAGSPPAAGRSAWPPAPGCPAAGRARRAGSCRRRSAGRSRRAGRGSRARVRSRAPS